MEHKYVRVKKKEYDDLCDKLRHLQTLAKQYDKRSKKMFELISDMEEEIQAKKVEIMDKIQQLEHALARIDGKVIDCESCEERCDVHDSDS